MQALDHERLDVYHLALDFLVLARPTSSRCRGGQGVEGDKRRYDQQQVPLLQHPRPPGTGTGTGTGEKERSPGFRDTP